MKTKTLVQWVGALVVVALVVILGAVLRSRRPSERSQLFFPALAENSCSSVTVALKADTVRLKRTGDVWVVAGGRQEAGAAGLASGLADSAAAAQDTAAPTLPLERDYPVDSAMFASMMEKLKTMKKDELISQNPDKQTLFEVDSVNGTLVQVWNDKGTLAGAFRIGKNGPGWSSHYVRLVGSNDVYSVQGSIKYSFPAETNRWRDRTIVKFARSAARSITLAKKAGVRIVMEKGADSTGAPVWNLAVPVVRKAAADKVEAMLNALTRLTCMDWETNAQLTDKDMGFAEPELTVTVGLEGGGERTIVIGKLVENQSKFWVRNPELPGVTFFVSSYTIETLDKNVEALSAAEEIAQDSASAPEPAPKKVASKKAGKKAK